MRNLNNTAIHFDSTSIAFPDKYGVAIGELDETGGLIYNGKKYSYDRNIGISEFINSFSNILFNEWKKDPCYDLYPVHYNILSQEDNAKLNAKLEKLAAEQIKIWNDAATLEAEKRARELGCSPQLADYILQLEKRILRLVELNS